MVAAASAAFVVVVVVVVIVVFVVIAADVMTAWASFVGGCVGFDTGTPSLREGAVDGFVGMVVISGGPVTGARSSAEPPRATPSSRSRAHTPILP